MVSTAQDGQGAGAEAGRLDELVAGPRDRGGIEAGGEPPADEPGAQAGGPGPPEDEPGPQAGGPGPPEDGPGPQARPEPSDERLPGMSSRWQREDLSWRPLTLGLDDGWPPPPLVEDGNGAGEDRDPLPPSQDGQRR
ncbi:MAG: hypothetical protein JO169_13270 [Solirubrobacterales bacterium]|nr:hypothetical protein [Solirubrobacterales bacterium]